MQYIVRKLITTLQYYFCEFGGFPNNTTSTPSARVRRARVRDDEVGIALCGEVG